MIKFIHTLKFVAEKPVVFQTQSIRLFPRTPVLRHRLSVDPHGLLTHYEDDECGRFVHVRPVGANTVLMMTNEIVVSPMYDGAHLDQPISTARWPLYSKVEPEDLHVDATMRLDMTVRFVREAVRRVEREEPGVRTADQTLRAGEGSCRDIAWLLVQLARRSGYPARFVSGYLVNFSQEKPIVGMHAWTEIFMFGAWRGFDASVDSFMEFTPSVRYVSLAAAPHWRDAAPVSGHVQLARVTVESQIIAQRMNDAEG